MIRKFIKSVYTTCKYILNFLLKILAILGICAIITIYVVIEGIIEGLKEWRNKDDASSK
jgi:hypothetical protein